MKTVERSPVLPTSREPHPSSKGWASDLALVGAVTAPTSLAVWTASVPLLPMLVFALSGGLTGALLGRFVPLLLHHRVRRMPVPLLLGAGLGVGANWGALVYAAPLFAVSGVVHYRALGAAAAVGMLQLGWFWLPYVLRKSRGESTFGLVVAACAASPVIAALAYLHAFVSGAAL